MGVPRFLGRGQNAPKVAEQPGFRFGWIRIRLRQCLLRPVVRDYASIDAVRGRYKEGSWRKGSQTLNVLENNLLEVPFCS
jgi:hypothetical protein